jgi:DNA-binding winged helix-turn-helix (wHTH) protein
MGFRACGKAGFGLRRMMVSPEGTKKRILKDGEHKALRDHHTILVPGPEREVKIIQKIFSLATHTRNTPRKIAYYLNRNKMWPWSGDERRWEEHAIWAIITNEKYIGYSVFGKTTNKLGGPYQRLPRDKWIMTPNAFTPLVEPAVFERVRKAIRSRSVTHPISRSDDYYLRGLKRVLAKHGKITQKLSKGSGIYSSGIYRKRFGSMMRAYDLVGYKPSIHAFKSVANQTKAKRLRTDLLNQLKEMYPENLRTSRLPGQTQRQVLEFDRHVRVSVHICRPCRRPTNGQPRWILKAQPLEEGYPCLICLPDSGLTKILSFYVMPQFGGIVKKYKVLHEKHKWLAAGRKLDDLSQLRVIATVMTGEWQEKDDTTIVGDVVLSSRTTAFTIGRREITLSPINAELFKVLLLNSGCVISDRQLIHPFSGLDFPLTQIRARVADLRKKLGFPLRDRIQTVKNKGYMYEIPKEEAGARCGVPLRSTLKWSQGFGSG